MHQRTTESRAIAHTVARAAVCTPQARTAQARIAPARTTLVLAFAAFAVTVLACTAVPATARAGGGDGATTSDWLGSLDGSTWVLTAIGADAPGDGQNLVTLTFDGDQVVGGAGCNRYFAGISAGAAGAIEIGPAGATRMMCEPAAMDLEGRFLQALGEARQLRINDGVLVLDGGAPGERLTFRPGAPAR